MLVAIDGADIHLGDLVSEVEAGGEVVLTRRGRAVARLVALRDVPRDRQARRASIDAARALARGRGTAGESAARSQDFLYADDGTPG